MEKNKLIELIVEKISGDNGILKAVGELTLDMPNIKIAEEQEPDTMYVLTATLKVKSEGVREIYHYHPIIKDCFINPAATDNEMVASSSLVDLQKEKEEYTFPIEGVEFVILAVPYEEYKKLKAEFDELIADIIASARYATENVMKIAKHMPKEALNFGKVYASVMRQIANQPQTVMGTALNNNSEIIGNIHQVNYEGFDTSRQSDDSDEDDEDSDDDGDSYNYRVPFFGHGF